MSADVLSLGFTPYPNDTFLFHALSQGLTPPPAVTNAFVADLENLNQRVLSGRADVCKISTNILPLILKDYVVLRAGAALGHGCGPLVVGTEQCPLEKLSGKLMATPGLLTTAHLLLTLNGAHTGPFLPLVPEAILHAVSSGQADAGLIIHEERFVIDRFGLHQILDLGSWWAGATGLPLPLGVMVMRRSLGNTLHLAMEAAIRESLQYAQSAPEASRPYIRKYARKLDPMAISGFIRSYVNEFATELGPEGEAAVKSLLKQTLALQCKTLPENLPLFPTGDC